MIGVRLYVVICPKTHVVIFAWNPHSHLFFTSECYIWT
jgi:hypothetical protein